MEGEFMTIYELRNRVLSLESLQYKMKSIEQAIILANENISYIKKSMQAGHSYMNKSKSMLASMFNFIQTDGQDDLEQMQQNDHLLNPNFDRAMSHLASLERDRKALAREIAQLEADKVKYQDIMKVRKEELLADATCNQAMTYIELEKQYDTLIAQANDLRIVLALLAKTTNDVYVLENQLENAKIVAEFEKGVRPGLSSAGYKFEIIGKSEKYFEVVNENITKIRSLVSHEHWLEPIDFKFISQPVRTMGAWVGGLGPNYLILSDIKHNYILATELKESLDVFSMQLSSQLNAIENDIAINMRIKDDMLLFQRQG